MVLSELGSIVFELILILTWFFKGFIEAIVSVNTSIASLRISKALNSAKHSVRLIHKLIHEADCVTVLNDE